METSHDVIHSCSLLSERMLVHVRVYSELFIKARVHASQNLLRVCATSTMWFTRCRTTSRTSAYMSPWTFRTSSNVGQCEFIWLEREIITVEHFLIGCDRSSTQRDHSGDNVHTVSDHNLTIISPNSTKIGQFCSRSKRIATATNFQTIWAWSYIVADHHIIWPQFVGWLWRIVWLRTSET